MNSNQQSRYQQAMSRSGNRALGSLTILAWVASSGGKISPAQKKLLGEFATARQTPGILELAMGVIQSAQPRELEMACVVVRGLSEQGKRALMTWALNIATAENRLPSSTNYLLRFLSDLLGVAFDEFCRTAGKNIPAPGDPSSLEWWQAFEGNGTKKGKQKGKQRSAKKKKGELTEAEALAILNLKPGTDEAEIASAFRKLASIHHPDRHAHRDAEQQQVAARNFAKIRQAFEVLTQK